MGSFSSSQAWPALPANIQLFSPCILITVQEKVRAQLGAQVTAFDSVEDGQQTLHNGDVLRLATKPVVVGRALHFIVGQVSMCIFLSVGLSHINVA